MFHSFRFFLFNCFSKIKRSGSGTVIDFVSNPKLERVLCMEFPRVLSISSHLIFWENDYFVLKEQ